MDKYLIYLATPYSAGVDDDNAFLLCKDSEIKKHIGSGLNHCLRNLFAIVREAVLLDRIPVLLPPILWPRHNLNHRIAPSWRRYYDLDNIEIVVRYRGLAARLFSDRVIPAKDFRYIEYEEFKKLRFSRGEYKQIGAHRRISLRKNRRYRLIARYNAFNPIWSMWWWRWPEFWWQKARRFRRYGISLNHQWVLWLLASLPKFFHYRYWPNVIVRLPPARDIKETAQQVSAALGDKYYVLHIRRDEFAERVPAIDKATRPRAILDRIQTFVPRGVTLYIMTDERDPRYFDLLREHYEVYQYFDFPSLAACIDTPDPDNYKLFMIESQIRDTAHQVIETVRVGVAPLASDALEDTPERDRRIVYLMQGNRYEYVVAAKAAL